VTRSLVQQAFGLHARFPEVRAKLKPDRLIWTGKIQPTPGSRVYTVRITYEPGRFPRVRVVSPALQPRPGEALPHLFSDGTLCLHLDNEWTPDMLIADTTLPWTSEWLINYEIWKATGDWYGGGQWPPPRRQELDQDAADAEDSTSPAQASAEGR
jgi:hypothetical protein